MLKGIDPLLNGALLKAMDELGHGETLILTDRNFRAHASGATVIRVDSDLVTVARAVLTVFPLDPGVPLTRMQVDGEPETVLPQASRVLELATESNGGWEPLERSAFYARAGQVGLAVLTRETEPYANVIFTKGVVE